MIIGQRGGRQGRRRARVSRRADEAGVPGETTNSTAPRGAGNPRPGERGANTRGAGRSRRSPARNAAARSRHGRVDHRREVGPPVPAGPSQQPIVVADDWGRRVTAGGRRVHDRAGQRVDGRRPARHPGGRHRETRRPARGRPQGQRPARPGYISRKPRLPQAPGGRPENHSVMCPYSRAIPYAPRYTEPLIHQGPPRLARAEGDADDHRLAPGRPPEAYSGQAGAFRVVFSNASVAVRSVPASESRKEARCAQRGAARNRRSRDVADPAAAADIADGAHVVAGGRVGDDVRR